MGMIRRVAGTWVLLVALVGCRATPAPIALDPAAALERVARGELAWADLVDPSAGLAYAVAYDDASGESPRADPDGIVRETRRICDADDEAYAALTRELALHYQPEFDYVPVRCEELVCRAAGPMEYATTLRFEFVRRGPALVLARVYRVEDVAIVDEAAAQRWAEAERAVAALPPRCDVAAAQ